MNILKFVHFTLKKNPHPSIYLLILERKEGREGEKEKGREGEKERERIGMREKH